jgi:outer membrane protein
MLRNLVVVVLITFFAWDVRQGNAEEEGGSLSLDQSIGIALERSAFLHSAQEGVRGAKFKKNGALSEFLFKVKSGYSFATINEPQSAKQAQAPGEPEIFFGPKDTFTFTLSVEQPLFTGGALVTNYQLAKLGIDVAQIQQIQAVMDLIRRVKEAYYSILKAEKILGVANQTVEQVTEHVKVAKAFYEVGLTPKNDLLEAEVELAQTKQDLIRAENGLSIAKSKFNTELRRDINEKVTIEDILTYVPSSEELDDCIQRAYEQRPEMQEVKVKVEQAKKEVTLARSDYFPDLAFKFNYERVGDKTNVQGNDFRDAERWEVAIGAEWTFWEWGKTHFSVNESKVRLLQAIDAEIQVRDSVTLEVKEAFLNLKESEKNIFVAETVIEQAKENFRMNKERYQEQVATTTDVLDAQTLLTQAEKNYYHALSDYNIDRARLERAIGAHH